MKSLFSSPAFPDILHIETSYRCNLNCRMCPRAASGGDQGVFAYELFEREIVPHLSRFSAVNLTGWGEPLMHPEIHRFVRECREADCFCAFATNGLLLTETIAERLFDAGLSAMNISCDAADAETYELVRGRGTFDEFQSRVGDFLQRKKSRRSAPHVEMVYVMMKPNIEQLPQAVDMAARLGFDRFVAKHMETATDREELTDALFNTGIAPDLTPEEEETFQRALNEARCRAETTGIELEIHPRRYEIEGHCLAMPHRSLFVDWLGNVSPCCHLGARDVRPFLDKPPQDNGLMGRVTDASDDEGAIATRNKTLDAVARSDTYRRFRRQWAKRTFPPACAGCLILRRMEI